MKLVKFDGFNYEVRQGDCVVGFVFARQDHELCSLGTGEPLFRSIQNGYDTKLEVSGKAVSHWHETLGESRSWIRFMLNSVDKPVTQYCGGKSRVRARAGA